MPSYNRVILIGHIGQDAERKMTKGEAMRPKVEFSLATNHNYKNRAGEWQKQTDWHNVVVWGDLADRTGELLKKGKQVFVEGRLHKRTYTDNENKVRYFVEVVADRVMLMGKPPENGHASNGAGSGEPLEAEAADDMPF